MKSASKRMACAIACILCGLSFHLQAADSAPEAPHCRYVNLKTIPITYNDGGLKIEASINEQPVNMVLDTGADTSTVSKHGAERLGLKLGHAGEVIGAGGESRGYRARVDKFSIGPVEGKHLTLPVFWDSGLDEDEDGLVGADFLFQRDLELSIKSRQIKLLHPLNCKSDTNLAYWDHDASFVDMEQAQPGTSANPGGDQGREVTVLLNGKKLRAKIDTGATVTIIDLAAAKRAGITPESPGVVKLEGKSKGIGSKRKEIWKATFDSFALGDETVPHAKIDIMDLWGSVRADDPEVDTSELPEMLLGADFLEKHHVLFAVSQRRFYFSYLGGGLYGSELDDVVSPTAAK